MKTFNQYITEAIEFLGWNEANKIIDVGTIFTIRPWKKDVTWEMKRTRGKKHADVEPLTANDTKKMMDTMGKGDSFEEAEYTSVIVDVNGRKMAAALMNFVHGGNASEPSGKIVNKLSGGFKNVVNVDFVKNNNATGHVCLHFLGSLRHTDNKIDHKAQKSIYMMRANK